MNKKFVRKSLIVLMPALLLAGCSSKTGSNGSKGTNVKNAFNAVSTKLKSMGSVKSRRLAKGNQESDYTLVESNPNLFNSIRAFTVFVENLATSKNYSFIDDYEFCTMSYSGTTFNSRMKLTLEEDNNATDFYITIRDDTSIDNLIIHVDYNFVEKSLSSFSISNYQSRDNSSSTQVNYYYYKYMNGSLYSLNEESSLFEEYKYEAGSISSVWNRSDLPRYGENYTSEYTSAMNTVFGKQSGGGGNQSEEKVDLERAITILENMPDALSSFINEESVDVLTSPLYVTIIDNINDNEDMVESKQYLSFFYNLFKDSKYYIPLETKKASSFKMNIDNFTHSIITNVAYDIDEVYIKFEDSCDEISQYIYFSARIKMDSLNNLCSFDFVHSNISKKLEETEWPSFIISGDSGHIKEIKAKGINEVIIEGVENTPYNRQDYSQIREKIMANMPGTSYCRVLSDDFSSYYKLNQ